MEKDLQLIHKIAQGDTVSFQELYELYKSRVYNTSLSLLQHPESAEEICQDVFVEVFQSAKGFSANSKVSTWLYRITVNKCLDLLRYQKRKKRFGFLLSLWGEDGREILQLPVDFKHPGVLLEQEENARLLFSELEKLPMAQKTAFVLRYIEELPQKEIAEVLKVSEKAAESLIQRAKANLRKSLEKKF